MQNYADYKYLKEYNEHNQIAVENSAKELEKAFFNIPTVQRFFSICRTANSKPYFSFYSESQTERETNKLTNNLPATYKSVF